MGILLSAGDVCCFTTAIILALCYNMHVVLLKLPSVKVYRIYVSGFIRSTCISVCNDRLLKRLVYVFSLFFFFFGTFHRALQYLKAICMAHGLPNTLELF